MCFTLATVKEFDDLPVQKDEPVTRARQRHGGTSRTLAWLLDDLITIPGTNRRVGLDPLVGLVPGAGDIVTMVATGSTLIDGLRYRVPLLVLLRMIVNMGLDSLIGSIPLVGDAFDFLFKANRRNVALLENAIADGNQAKMSAKRYFIVVGVLVVLAFVAVLALIIWLIAFIVGQIGWF
ncbi:protein of unknown function [Corynebacterium glucuronolyticum]|nr:hypothetical protein CGLUCO_06725 [Corynebacterium glucuronolyticum DSM 44120]SMB81117.1 protein of unknown function [Corynebacterium glucuronolyticum]